MKMKTNAENRKAVVKAVSEILGIPSKYLGVPSCNFQVGDCIIDRAGTVETEDEKTAGIVLAGLIERGYADAPETEENKVVIGFPAEGMTALNLKNLIFLMHSRQYLINRSIGEKNFSISDGLVEELEENGDVTIEGLEDSLKAFADETRGIAVSSEKITFRFPYTEDAVKVKAWTDLASAMVRQVKEQKRIDPEERIEENEKYYMRIWLLRIGFGGKDMKESRNTLMEKLKGHSAFRTQADIDRAKVRTKQRLEAKKLTAQEAREQEETVSGLILEETGSGEEKEEPSEAA
ncbi:hypothetical protein [Enterocloster clostridioformis]|uniref:hypothetical protein n=1 Tax=Enterocloster clostridioformis TaxID=1531 RepID=UPI0022E5FEE8|nr:hypothetical protein [Enterocloster clostridioformis]